MIQLWFFHVAVFLSRPVDPARVQNILPFVLL